eukprot:gnl/TRDRNA2_/TRDRNA2_128375_c2_seq2.p1 gnl/TRDRNA2_/TRDRNA2_128375_c2~~gnl/TRDRNA2_/TRDRNA2_128375_c2_seq2.p1  ORF type:complete len:219 (+),score=37.80 gnl/TRDRNA2_/TRDRNA2_128375_c2_seq2:17-673(+)
MHKGGQLRLFEANARVGGDLAGDTVDRWPELVTAMLQKLNAHHPVPAVHVESPLGSSPSPSFRLQEYKIGNEEADVDKTGIEEAEADQTWNEDADAAEEQVEALADDYAEGTGEGVEEHEISMQSLAVLAPVINRINPLDPLATRIHLLSCCIEDFSLREGGESIIYRTRGKGKDLAMMQASHDDITTAAVVPVSLFVGSSLTFAVLRFRRLLRGAQY